MPGVVKMEVSGSVALLMLGVPPINALDEGALHDLQEAVDGAERDEDVRAVVISSGIDGFFCAGGDLKYWPCTYPGDARTVGAAGRKVFSRIEELGKPTVAAIQGRVIGDGLSLALACDIRLASPDSTFRLPELDYGFIPGWGTVGRLIETVGKSATAELLLLGDEMGASDAQALGLIHRVVSSEDLLCSARSRRNGSRPSHPWLCAMPRQCFGVIPRIALGFQETGS